MNLGIHLRTHRITHRLTQKEMAEKLGITREYCARLEEGVGRPSVVLLERICTLTGVPASAFFKKTDGASSGARLPRMCTLCAHLSDRNRREIEQLMKRMLKG